MKKIFKIFPIVLFLLLVGCGKPVQLDVKLKESKAQMNIFGRLDDDSTTIDKIIVQKSVSYLKPADSIYVPTAVVIVKSDKGDNWLFTYAGNGLFMPPANYDGVEYGVKYTLQVTYEGITYQSTTQMDYSFRGNVLPITKDSTGEVDKTSNSFEDEPYRVYAFFKDNTTFKNYYYFNAYRNDTLITKAAENDDRTFVYAFDDKNLDNSGVDVPFRLFNKFKLGDSVKIDLYTIDYNTYKYYEALSDQTNNSGSIFDGPPANIVGNISNGAVGYFYVSSCYRYKFAVKLK